MASQGGVLFQEKVGRLLSRQNGKPVLKPNRPLVLKDYITDRKPMKGEATCITEMTVMMACWKVNNFVDDLCLPELSSFYACVDQARIAKKGGPDQTSVRRRSLDPKQIMTLLKRFPNPRTEM